MSDADRIKRLEQRVKQLEAALEISNEPFVRECDVSLAEVSAEHDPRLYSGPSYPGWMMWSSTRSHAVFRCEWGDLKVPITPAEGVRLTRDGFAIGTLRLEFK